MTLEEIAELLLKLLATRLGWSTYSIYSGHMNNFQSWRFFALFGPNNPQRAEYGLYINSYDKTSLENQGLLPMQIKLEEIETMFVILGIASTWDMMIQESEYYIRDLNTGHDSDGFRRAFRYPIEPVDGAWWWDRTNLIDSAFALEVRNYNAVN
jgi:hypothetical protein